MIDLKDKINKFKSEPGRVFGLIYPYILIVIAGIGFYYISNLDKISRQSIPAVPPDTTRVTDLPVVEPKTIPSLNILGLSRPAPELIAKGKESYTTICASCHGEEGKGDGPAGAGLNPKPRDFTHKENWKNGMKLSQIYQTLEEGIPGSGMISYNYLLPEERIAIAHYIRESFIPDPPQDSEGELLALDQTYSLSQGKEIPAQIPVETAMNIIINESGAAVRDLSQKLDLIYSDATIAQIFSNITSNRLKALVTLNADRNWKGDFQKFIDSVIYNLNTNGFNDNALKMSSAEWDLLYSFMNRIF